MKLYLYPNSDLTIEVVAIKLDIVLCRVLVGGRFSPLVELVDSMIAFNLEVTGFIYANVSRYRKKSGKMVCSVFRAIEFDDIGEC